MEMISPITISVTEALDSTQRISAFLIWLKDEKADRVGNPFPFFIILVLLFYSLINTFLTCNLVSTTGSGTEGVV
jgi:hypothetical protein